MSENKQSEVKTLPRVRVWSKNFKEVQREARKDPAMGRAWKLLTEQVMLVPVRLMSFDERRRTNLWDLQYDAQLCIDRLISVGREQFPEKLKRRIYRGHYGDIQAAAAGNADIKRIWDDMQLQYEFEIVDNMSPEEQNLTDISVNFMYPHSIQILDVEAYLAKKNQDGPPGS
jgi:hypothetical protein